MTAAAAGWCDRTAARMRIVPPHCTLPRGQDGTPDAAGVTLTLQNSKSDMEGREVHEL